MLEDWNSPIGGNWAYLVKNKKSIGEFIKANAIQAVAVKAVAAEAVTPRAAKAAAEPAKAAKYLDLDIRGGMRVPHLHFNNKIYMLDEKQWAAFSGAIVADVKAKLAKTKEVSFEEGMALANLSQAMK